MTRARVPAVEAAEAARRACEAAGPSDARERARERARATGSLMTPGEVADRLGSDTVEVAVVTYRLSPGGRIDPPVEIVVRCLPSALEGVYRSMAKLMESRQWASEARVSRDRVPRASIEEFLKGEMRG